MEIPRPTVLRFKNTIFAIVYFAQDSFFLDGANYKAVEKLSEELKYIHNPNVIVDGHASSEGKKKYNLDLSKKRRFGIISLLSSKTKPLGTIHFSGEAYGESKLAEPETAKKPEEMESQRARNRRVEVLIIPTKVEMPKKSIDLSLPMKYKPETLDERMKRILTQPPLKPVPKRSVSELFWNKFDNTVEDILRKAGVSPKYRGYIKKGARSLVEKGLEKALDKALDQTNINDKSKKAIKHAIEAAAETKF